MKEYRTMNKYHYMEPEGLKTIVFYAEDDESAWIRVERDYHTEGELALVLRNPKEKIWRSGPHPPLIEHPIPHELEDK